MAEAAFSFLAASSFTMAFNLPVGRFMLAVALVLFLLDCWQTRRMPEIKGVMWLALLFIAAAIVATVHGVDPAGTWPKLKKLPWFLGMIAYAGLVTTPFRLTVVLGAFASGAGVLALWNIVGNPIAAFRAAGDGVSFMHALMNEGSMTDAQMLMAGIMATLGRILVLRREGRKCLLWVGLLVLQGLALLISFKRGSWICLVAVLGAVLAMKTNWRYVAGLAAAVALIALLPPVRHRLADTAGEFDTGKGGRLTMWFKVAPEIHASRPWLGIGWRAMNHDMMRAVAPSIEPNRNHLHSNIAEILVATGWIGFAVYISWMVKALLDAVSFHLGSRQKSAEEEFNSLALMAVLCAILLNGVVEFNFGDAELVLLYCMVMGCAVAGRDRLVFRPLGIGLQVH